MATMFEKDILDSLDDLGYKGSINNDDRLPKELEKGLASGEYTNLIYWLASELKLLCDLEEHVHQLKDGEDEEAFLMELSSFIRELGCPHSELMEGRVNQRMSSVADKMRLLEFLITELLAARMTVVKKKRTCESARDGTTQTVGNSRRSHLESACIALELQEPVDGTSWRGMLKNMTGKVSKIPSEIMGKPLFIGTLSEEQWRALDQLNDGMKMEYKIRAEMLLQRLDVTVQSFSWSDRVKQKEDELVRVYEPLRRILKPASDVTIADVLAARQDLTIIEKTASSTLRTNTTSKLNKLMIKNRPADRGGRPNEIRPPPPEMPSWQKRVPGPAQGYRGRGGGWDRGSKGHQQYGRGGGYERRDDYTSGYHPGRGRGRGRGRGERW